LRKALLGLLIVLFYGSLIAFFRANHAESEAESEAPIAGASKVTPRDDATPLLELPEDAVAQAGIETRSLEGRTFALPSSALVRSDGRTWVYFAMENGKFSREEVTPEANRESGAWKLEGEAPSTKLVTVGAQTLLSEEMKSQISVGDGD
jgi:hypothetical protein